MTRAFRPQAFAALAVLLACSHPPPAPSKLETMREIEHWPDPPPPTPPPPTAESLPDGQPGLRVINPTHRDIDIYAVHLVDAAGLLGTRVLWPNPYDCKGRAHLRRPVPKNGGRFTLPPPARTYLPGGCELGPPLPDGDYVVLVDSGYADLHAAASITLPMREPVELRIEPHVQAIPCTDAVARRAANLVTRAPSSAPLPPGFLDGCDIDRAHCVAGGEEPPRPPERCEITLFTHDHGALLRIAKPPGNDALRGLIATLDHAVVHSRPPQIARTSSSAYPVDGAQLVVAGTTSTLWHVHGGDAATINSVFLQVHNPLDRPVAYRVDAIEFLVGYSCELPAKIKTRPALTGAAPRDRLPPGASTLKLSFATQSAYQGHCERFAARVHLTVEGLTRPVTSEYFVGRYDLAD